MKALLLPNAIAVSAALLAASLDTGLAQATGEHLDIAVEVRGSGRPLLFIPGLNSAAETWGPTCDALIANGVQCHLLQLPGFAGQPPVTDEPWLDAMRDRVLDYVESAELEQPVLVGHSLGGLLSLKLGLAAPDRFSHLVIVDSLPFFPAAQNPAATEEMMRPMAAGMRQGMRSMPEEAYTEQSQFALRGMSNQPERTETLKAWSAASDRWTTSQAMYELMTVDLRAAVSEIRTPTLVLGAWVAYQDFGATRESTLGIFESQYAALPGVRIELSDSGFHFLMWDDPQWLQPQIREFLNLSSAP